MVKEFHFYVDDSGSRDPDRKPTAHPSEPNWFALGGVIVSTEHKNNVDAEMEKFRERWPQIGKLPLRSYDIRNRTNGFNWLEAAGRSERDRFYSDLTELVLSLPIVVLACVVDRPGYNRRYAQQYGPRRWKLCRTAFNIAVERAAKFAKHHEVRLRVFVEQSDKVTERQLKQYYEDMRETGLPFNVGTSAKYRPLDSESMRETLLEFRVKTKASLLMQLADLVLWPACKGGYDSSYVVYQQLQSAGKLIDFHCTSDNGLQGIKYSCFDTPETQKPA